MAENWQVTHQRETTTNVGNAWVKAMEVTFKTSGDVTGTVVVPMTAYNADEVGKAIDARVAQIEAVKAL
jgi:hypothetical protein